MNASHLSDQGHTVNTCKSMFGVVKENITNCLLHVSLFVINDVHFHIPNTMYVFFYATVCFLFSMQPEIDNKVLLVSYNINKGVS